MQLDPQKRKKYLISGVVFLAIIAAIYFLFLFQKAPKSLEGEDTVSEVKTLSDIELVKRPYVTLSPTSDGAELIISIENMGYFDKIEYEIIYLADNPQASGEKIQRGATGTDVNTKEQKYKKSILLGTASKGVRSPDRGISEGKLAMHMYKGDIQYDSETPWDMVEVSTGTFTVSGQNQNFELKGSGFTKDYWVVLADTVGVPAPKDFDISKVTLPSYGTFSIAPKFTKKASLSIKVGGSASDYELFIYDHNNSSWGKPDSAYDPSTKTLTSQVEYFSTFVVVAK